MKGKGSIYDQIMRKLGATSSSQSVSESATDEISAIMIPSTADYDDNYSSILYNRGEEIEKHNDKVRFNQCFIEDYYKNPEEKRFRLIGHTAIPRDKTEPDKAVIHCRGNSEFYEQFFEEMKTDATNLDCLVVGFNYPDAGLSKQYQKNLSSEELIDSVKSVVQYVTENYQIDPENIVLKGHSLGSAIATHAAAELHQDNQKVSLFNGRSFNSLSTEASKMINISRLKGLANAILNKTGLNLEPAEAYDKIPEGYKTFVNVENDGVIPQDASMYQAQMDKIKRNQSGQEHEISQQKTQQQLKTLEKNHWLKPVQKKADRPHNEPLKNLQNEKGQNGQQIFENFAKQAFRPTMQRNRSNAVIGNNPPDDLPPSYHKKTP